MGRPLVLVDADLFQGLGAALRPLAYNITTVREVFSEGRRVLDPQIIDWLAQRNGVWLTKDWRAKRQHEPNIRRARISIVWLRPAKKLKLGSEQQLEILAHYMKEINNRLEEAAARGQPTYIRIRVHGGRGRFRMALEEVSDLSEFGKMR